MLETKVALNDKSTRILGTLIINTSMVREQGRDLLREYLNDACSLVSKKENEDKVNTVKVGSFERIMSLLGGVK